MPELRVVINGETTATYPLTSETVTLGRDVKNTIVLRDQTASSSHAQILMKPEGCEIQDLNSRNGTLVNSWPVQSVILRHGDRIQIGTIELLFIDEDDQPQGRGVESDEYLQSIFASVVIEDDVPRLPSLVIDDLDSSPEVDPGMSFVGFAPTNAAEGAVPFLGKPGIDDSVNEATEKMAAPNERSPDEHVAETKLRLVQQVSEKLVRIFEPQQLLDEIMTIVVQQTGADRGLLCLLDDKRQPVPIAARGIAGNQQVRVSRTVLGRLLNGRTGVLINTETSAFQSLAEMQVQSTMCAPLWTGDRIVGILSLDSMTIGKSFSQQDLELLLAVAHPVAVGIERNRLSHQIDTERQLRDYMSKYLDHRVVEQISQGQRSGNDPLAPTECEVTILFSDIVSFTKMSESLTAVELAEFMRKYLTSMTDVVFSHGGTIDKYIGDAVMALFGAPVPSADSAENAIRTALEMQNRIKQIELPGAKGKALRVRVGINTGPVVVGNLGSERRSEYTALGDAVNVASRLETFARPNEICIDELTYEKTKDVFDVEEIGTIDVKNRAEPVVVYKVIGERRK
jgi:adenylate cyclase